MVKLERREGVPAARQGSVSKESTVMGDSEKTGLCREDRFVCVHVCAVHTCVCLHVRIGML